MIYDLQKANIWKRISAALLDVILLLVLITGIAFFMSFALDVDGQTAKLQALYDRYEEKYGISFDLSIEEAENLNEEELEIRNAAVKEMNEDPEFRHVSGMIFNFSLIIAVFSILISYLILEFVLPLIFGNGQTIGKKIFGIGLIRFDGVRLSHILLFIRTLLGKYTMETMVPVFLLLMCFFNLLNPLLVIGILLGYLIVQIVLMIVSHTNSLLHDKLAGTVVVDLASQMIFESSEEMIAYKKRLHEEEAERAEYP